jgi:hypothetical protein
VPISPVTDGTGEVVNFVGVQNDVTERLDAHHSPMIGVLPVVGGAPGRGAASVRCPPGSLLLLYTDGLTDVAGEDAGARTTALERAVAAVPPGGRTPTRSSTRCSPPARPSRYATT